MDSKQQDEKLLSTRIGDKIIGVNKYSHLKSLKGEELI
jgi:hypothetical protein